jgi:hypothetical protein
METCENPTWKFPPLKKTYFSILFGIVKIGKKLMHPQFLDRLNCKSKGENIGRIMSWGTLFGLQHFEGRWARWSPKM